VPDSFFGLPVHPLVVHAAVVLVPLAAIVVAVCAAVPRTRRRLAWPAAVGAAVATLAAVVADQTGESLQARVPDTTLIREHATVAKLVVLSMVATTGAALLLAYVQWWRADAPVAPWLRLPTGLVRAARPRVLAGVVHQAWLLPAVVALALVMSAGAVVSTAVVGHLGAKAVWSGVSKDPLPGARRR